MASADSVNVSLICSRRKKAQSFLIGLFTFYLKKFGATHRVRTDDLNLGKVALYQLS